MNKFSLKVRKTMQGSNTENLKVTPINSRKSNDLFQ